MTDSESDEDSESEEEAVKTREHSAQFYKWGTDAWDLHFKTPEDLVIADEETRLDMDRGRAAVWKVMNARNKKKLNGCCQNAWA